MAQLNLHGASRQPAQPSDIGREPGGGGQFTSSGFRDQSQVQVSGIRVRSRFQGSESGSGFRHQSQAQGSGIRVRFRFKRRRRGQRQGHRQRGRRGQRERGQRGRGRGPDFFGLGLGGRVRRARIWSWFNRLCSTNATRVFTHADIDAGCGPGSAADRAGVVAATQRSPRGPVYILTITSPVFLHLSMHLIVLGALG